MAHSQNRGFTLVELMVTVALVAVVVSLAAPSFQRFIIDARMTAQANDFLTSLHFARSEAVKRNTTVTMCKSAVTQSCSTASPVTCTCATSGTWAAGWLIFVDEDASGAINGSDAILRLHGPLTNASTLVGGGTVTNLVTYQPSGQSSQNGQWDLCSSDTAQPGRNITLSVNTGTVRSVVDTVTPCT